MAQLKRYNGTSWETIGGVVTGDTLPIGSEVDYDGASAPAGWEEISNDLVVDSIETENMLDTDTIINGSVNKTTGAYSFYNYSCVSNYIEVKQGTNYIIKLNNITNLQFIFRIVLYNTDKTYNSTIFTDSEITQYTFTAAANGYVRICFGMNGYETIVPSKIAIAKPKMEIGITPTEFTPYLNTQRESLYTQAIWHGNKYTINSSENLAEKLIPGKLYVIAVRGLSSGYLEHFSFVYLGGNQSVQHTMYDGSTVVRWRINLTENTFVLSDQCMNMGSNTGVQEIYRIG